MDLATEALGAAGAPKVVPNPPMKKLSLRALLGTSLYTLGVNAVWISYNSIILPHQVELATSASTKALVVGLIEGVGIGIAVIINIITGIISDHFTSRRFGRRASVIVIGTLLTVPFCCWGCFCRSRYPSSPLRIWACNFSPMFLPLAFNLHWPISFQRNSAASALG